MSSDVIEIATTFFAHWSSNRLEDALSMLSDDVLYDNVPFPDIVGRDNVRKFNEDFRHWCGVQGGLGNAVLNERIDVFTHKNDGQIVLPVMGTITVENGMITVWRDYVDCH